MTENEALLFIHSAEKFGSVLGLDSMKRLCGMLGHPERGQKFIHIAGTNGKGSVAACLNAILMKAGLKTGLYTSPALVDFSERIKVNSVPIGAEDLTKITLKVKNACEALTAKGFPHPTEFEIVTAIGLLYFKETACRAVILEVGLGGRLDATNVIEDPELCIITSLSLDHTDRLGDTIEKIAAEKCGIIKGSVPVITTENQKKEALSVIRKKAENLTLAPVPSVKSETLSGITFDFDGIEDIFCPLTGSHQAENAALSITAAKMLNISDSDIKEGIKNTVHPARMEKVSDDPIFIIDGAHNESAMEYLYENLKRLLPPGKKTLIIGMLKDKNYEKSAKIISGIFDRIITVDIESPRALKKEELLSCFKKYHENVTAMPLKEAVGQIKKGEIFVAAGSLYMAGELKKLIRDMKF